ncbi:MAG TPA: PilN domain-containing protein [Gemmatimonadaceae bacterium]|jgi:Tfp pilus assembly protein PilN
MIEINLLPGGKRRQRRKGAAGAGFDLSALKALPAKIKDPYLIGGVTGLVVGLGALAVMYTTQGARTNKLAAAEEAAVKDSTNFARVLAQKVRAEATRDTVLRQLNVIRSIDEDRFIWPHILDEVSRALPPYTWLTTVAYSGTPQGTVNVVGSPAPAKAAKPAKGAPAKAKAGPKMDTGVTREEVSVRLEGRTVDIQALTRFMRELEASPFLSNVTLDRSELTVEQNKDITAFTLQMKYSRPDTTAVRRTPVTLSSAAN